MNRTQRVHLSDSPKENLSLGLGPNIKYAISRRVVPQDKDPGISSRNHEDSKAETTQPSIYAIRLTEEVLEKIRKSAEKGDVDHLPMHIQFGSLRDGASNLLTVGDHIFQFSQVPENQPVECYRQCGRKLSQVAYIGPIEQKILVRTKLDQKQKDNIRRKTAQAEEERQSRKVIVLESTPTISTRQNRRLERTIVPHTVSTLGRGYSKDGTRSDFQPEFIERGAQPHGNDSVNVRHVHSHLHDESRNNTRNRVALQKYTSPSSKVLTKDLSEKAKHLLAIQPLTIAVLCEKLGISRILLVHELRKFTVLKSPGRYHLRPEAYKDLHPYPFAYTDQERSLVLRNMQKAFTELKMPPDSQCWKLLCDPSTSTLEA